MGVEGLTADEPCCVVDFIEVQFTDFAVFNFADILVTVGAIAIMIYVIVDMFRERKKTGEKHE